MNSEKKGEFKEKNVEKRRVFVKISILILYLVFVAYLFYILLVFGINIVIILLILGFMSLLIIGTIFSRRKKTIYAELYPDKERTEIERPPRKIELKIDTEAEESQERKLRSINLNFKYRKSIINKCENCGMLITGSQKTCPTCGKGFELKEVIKKCKTCGMTIPKSTKKCPVCGTRVV